MQKFYEKIVEWIAQHLIIAGAHRARELIEEFEDVKALPAPDLPRIDLIK